MAVVTISLPAQLADLTEGRRSVQVHASTIVDALGELDKIAPMVRPQLIDEDGAFRRFVGCFVDGRQILSVRDNIEPLQPRTEIVIMIAIAGG